MMRKLLCCAASAAALILGANAADTAAPKKKVQAPAVKSATQPQQKTASTAPRTAPKTYGATKTGTARTGTTGARTSTAARRPGTTTTTQAARRPVSTWRNRQSSPSTDRYKEIQDALVSKGYLQAEDATGKWDSNSVEALKRFQAEQNLDSTGKINSLSLIALGLGPKYEAVPTKPSEFAPTGQR